MDFTPLNENIERLNRNLETVIGLIAAGGKAVNVGAVVSGSAEDVAKAASAIAATAAAATTPADPAAEGGKQTRGRGRPRTRYWYHSDRKFVQEGTESPGKEWVEVTKTHFEGIRDKIAKGEIQPVYDAPGVLPATNPVTTTTKPTNDDPFADDPADAAKAPTMDDARNAAFAVRDKFGMDKAKALIAKYAPQLKDVKPEDFAALIADCQKALEPDEL